MRDQCIAFHKAHPEVWDRFEALALELIASGVEHYGVATIWEVLRWESDSGQIAGGGAFKLNNNYRAFYARAFARRHPKHAGFFRLRRQRTEDEAATGLPELTPADFDDASGARCG